MRQEYDFTNAKPNPYYEGVGDFTAEKYDRPPQSFEEITARIKRASEEIRAEAEPDDENDDISAIFDGIRVDLTGHKFDRDVANDYD